MTILEDLQKKHAEAVRDLAKNLQKRETATASERRQLDKEAVTTHAAIDMFEERIVEVREQENREKLAANHRVEIGAAGYATIGYEEQTYRPDGTASFFGDLVSARSGDYNASQRLNRNNIERGLEQRALSTGATAGGTFAPPAWLVDEWIRLARPGRVTADLLNHEVLPQGVSSVNLPAVATGSTAGIQATQNTAVSNTDLTTTSVSSGISTISGQQVISLQLIQQSGIPFDRVILADLAADYARQLGSQVINGLGTGNELRGILAGAGIGTTAYTTTTPSVVSTTSANSFLNRVISSKATIATTRYMPATAIVMNPNRWAWIEEALDLQNRPLVLSDGNAFNSVGIDGSPTAEGHAGTFANLPVYVDPNIPTNLGVGTNQDVVIVLRQSDLWLWETELQTASFEATYANQNSILFRVLGYAAMIPDRYASATRLIGGTGLVAPVL